MPQLPEKPDSFKRATPPAIPLPGLSAESLNQIARATVRQVRGGGDTQANYYGDRVVLQTETANPQLPGVTNYLTQFVVLQELDDYLLCTPFVPPNDGTNFLVQVFNESLGENSVIIIPVAKSFLLQRTPWDGQTVNYNSDSVTYNYTGLGQRTATIRGGATTFQQITPPYFPGDVIAVVSAFTGYKGPNPNTPVVWNVSGTPVVEGTGDSPIVWMDANLGGRAWTIAPIYERADSTQANSGQALGFWGDYNWWIASPVPGFVNALYGLDVLHGTLPFASWIMGIDFGGDSSDTGFSLGLEGSGPYDLPYVTDGTFNINSGYMYASGPTLNPQILANVSGGTGGVRSMLFVVPAAPSSIIAYQSNSTAYTSSTGVFSVPAPTGTAQGDLLVAFQVTRLYPTIPTGWTVCGGGYDYLSNSTFIALYKVATNSEPPTYSFDSNTASSVTVVRLSGAAPSLTANYNTSYGSTRVGTLPYTTTSSNEVVLVAFSGLGNNRLFIGTTMIVELVDASTTQRGVVNTATQKFQGLKEFFVGITAGDPTYSNSGAALVQLELAQHDGGYQYGYLGFTDDFNNEIILFGDNVNSSPGQAPNGWKQVSVVLLPGIGFSLAAFANGTIHGGTPTLVNAAYLVGDSSGMSHTGQWGTITYSKPGGGSGTITVSGGLITGIT